MIQVPQYILDHIWGKGEVCKIVCTQPWRISATSGLQLFNLNFLNFPVLFNIEMFFCLCIQCLRESPVREERLLETMWGTR